MSSTCLSSRLEQRVELIELHLLFMVPVVEEDSQGDCSVISVFNYNPVWKFFFIFLNKKQT